MGSHEEYTQTDARNIGLDRADITLQGQIELPDQGFRKGDDEGARLQTEPEARSSTHHVVNSIKQKKHDAGIKIRRKLHISKPSDVPASSSSPILANSVDGNPLSRLDNASKEPEKHSLKDLLHNPVDTIKSKTYNMGNQEIAGNIAAKEIPHGRDVDILNAASAVDRAETDHEKSLAVKNLSELLEMRQSIYVRWTLDRHVTKIRVLPKNTVSRKPKTEFEKKSARGDHAVDWQAYAQHVGD